ncbi:MAG: baseplate J/gp47 family protein [Halanaerobiales bacterium]
MEVAGYRIYYISQNMEAEEIINLVESSMAKKLALVIHQNHRLGKDKKLLNKFTGGIIAINKEVVIINPSLEWSTGLINKGFKVFNNLDDLKSGEYYKFQKEAQLAVGSNDNDNNWKRTLIFLGMTISLIITGAYFLYPTVTVEIEPVVEIFREELLFEGSLASKPEEGLKLQEFEVVVNDKAMVDTTGRESTGIEAARGKVKFINESKNEVSIPSKTILSTEENIKFKTLNSVSVPPLQVDYFMDVPVGMKAGQAETEIEAVQKGTIGNVDTGEIIKGVEKEGVYVINSSPTRGGKDEETPVVLESDIKKLKKSLEDIIQNRLIAKVYQELGGDYRIIEEELKFDEMGYELNAEIGEAKKVLEGEGSLKAYGLMLKNDEINKILKEKLEKKREEKFEILDSKIDSSGIKLEKKGDKLYNIKIELKTAGFPSINDNKIAKKISGMSMNKVIDLLNADSNIENFKISGQRDKMPRLKYAINVKTEEPDVLPVFIQ